MTARIAALQRLQRGISTVELVHTPHELWPYPPSCCGTRNSLRIAVLDSSFNPPTLAHLALANSTPPQYSNTNTSASEPSPCSVHECNYDARLLLLSVRNADKSLKPGDATHLQRLDMMSLLNRDIVLHDVRETPACDDDANVAIAIIDEPTFVWKSSTLLAFLRQRFADLASSSTPSSPPTPQLVFLQGFDTLERLLSPRYYASEEAMLQSLRQFFSPQGDDSRVVCARRVQHPPSPHAQVAQGSSLDTNQSEREKLVLAKAKEFVEAERIILVDIGEDERAFSSSELRDKIARGNGSWKKMTTGHRADYIMEKKLYLS
jgi:nicotinamide-nucleotide adenylyltransferase